MFWSIWGRRLPVLRREFQSVEEALTRAILDGDGEGKAT